MLDSEDESDEFIHMVCFQIFILLQRTQWFFPMMWLAHDLSSTNRKFSIQTESLKELQNNQKDWSTGNHVSELWQVLALLRIIVYWHQEPEWCFDPELLDMSHYNPLTTDQSGTLTGRNLGGITPNHPFINYD